MFMRHRIVHPNKPRSPYIGITALVCAELVLSSACDPELGFEAIDAEGVTIGDDTTIVADGASTADASYEDDDAELTDEAEPSDVDPSAHALARVWLHAFRRYLEGFPGGASPVELELAESIVGQGLSDEELQGYVARLDAKLSENFDADDVEPLAQPVTEELLAAFRTSGAMLAAPSSGPAASECTPAYSTNGKYRFKFEGVGSIACTTDYGDPKFPPCADEEVFVAWTLFAPSAEPKSGLTNVETEVSLSREMDTFNYGNAAPGSLTAISSDALLVFRPFEKDGNYYSTYALTDLKAAGAAVKASINWTNVALKGKMQSDLTALYDVLSKSSAGDDDVFALQQFGLSEPKMWEATYGCYKPLTTFPFGVPNGDYFGYAMRVYTIASHLKLWVTLNRV